ncbi:hypothetical protein NX801_15505 [Streptomyces sp. LP05-1]|uniref:Lipoprotein n=1 Tax=Streptomyces pyxinae TaxID=2970734 RepID=A0ABT2CI04_9ACTN|nr:hypothetical protein [Streptomyces sp. LP05-1]MCS0637044.1 hypothetical protein [Streptomyces sp. LP05-1]
MGELNRAFPCRPRWLTPSILGLTLTLGLSGCTDGDSTPPSTRSHASSAKPTPSSTSSGRPEHIEGETVTRAPKPLDGKAVLKEASRTGSAALPLRNIGSGRLGIQVNCQGKGTLTVAVTPIGLSFPLACVDYEVSSTYNEIHLKRARSEGAIQISAPTTVRWALTVEQ